MAFDITQLKLAATTEMHLKHPATGELLYDTKDLDDTDESKPVVFHLYGKASKQHKKALEAMMLKNKNRKGKQPTLSESIQDNVDFIVALSIEVENMEFEGDKIDSPEVFRAMYSDPGYSWIVEQISEAIGDVQGFLTK